MNARATSVLAFDFGGTKVEVGIADGAGSPGRSRIEIGAGESARDVVARAIRCAESLMTSPGDVVAVGVSAPGIVFDDHVDLAPNVADWDALDLASELRRGLGVTALVIENDVKAAAMAEAMEGALADVDPGLYVNLGTGIAVASVIGGRVLRGAHAAAGEIGYGVVGAVPDWTGSDAPLEAYAGGAGLRRRLRERQGGPRTAAELATAAARRDPAALALWNDAVDEIARHLLTAALTIDPQRIVVGGGMTLAGDVLLDRLRARLDSALPYPVEIVPSRFGAAAALHGAMLLARSLAVDPAP